MNCLLPAGRTPRHRPRWPGSNRHRKPTCGAASFYRSFPRSSRFGKQSSYEEEKRSDKPLPVRALILPSPSPAPKPYEKPPKRSKLTDAQIPPTGAQGIGSVPDRVNLEPDKAGLGHVILEIGYFRSIYPGLDMVAFAHHAILGPFVVLEQLLDLLAGLRLGIEELPAARFVIDTTRVAADGDFHLVSMNAAVLVAWCALAADLHPRVQRRIHLHLKFELKIAVVLRGAKERIRAVGRRGPDDAAVLGLISRLAILLFPAGEIF